MAAREAVRGAALDRSLWLFDYDGVSVPAYSGVEIAELRGRILGFVAEQRRIPVAEAGAALEEMRARNPSMTKCCHALLSHEFPNVPLKELFERLWGSEGHYDPKRYLWDEEMIRGLAGIRANGGPRLAVFTNNSSAVVKRSMERKGISYYFDPVVLGWEDLFPYWKFNVEAYETALRRFNAGANEALLIDDDEEHLRIAEGLGIYTVHITNGGDDTGLADESAVTLNEFLRRSAR